MVFFAVLFAGQMNAQIIVPIQRTEVAEKNSSALNQQLRAYTVFTMDKRELSNQLHTNRGGLFQIRIDENLDWTLNMEINDMRAPNFR